MRYTQGFIKTNKGAKEYSSANATLLQKAGFIDQVMAGVYTYLPLGLRVLNKIEAIVREEMDAIGSELLMPALTPQEIWRQTGRLDTVDVNFEARGGNAASRKKNDATYVLNSTHEDLLTWTMSRLISSYKDLPFAVYQIQTKFRNEPRPKSGLLRGREFRMKDLYSFHASDDDFKKYYELVKQVYATIYARLGLGPDTIIAAASGKPFTDDYSHEFQTIIETGEDTIFIDDTTGEAFNREIAPCCAPPVAYADPPELKMQEVEGVGIVGVEALAAHLNISLEKTTKTILFETDRNEVIAAAVRGTYDINEEKLAKVVGAKSLQLASAEVVRQVTGAEVGYAGILALSPQVRIVMDESMQNRQNFECGANRTNYHTINVNFGRDVPVPEHFHDIKTAKSGDLNPTTKKPYRVVKASEVGNIFPLGTKYAQAFNWTYTDSQGMKHPIQMGSYGLGTSRVMGVIVEKYHDQHGVIWPEAVAPFTVHLIGLQLTDDSVREKCEMVYERLAEKVDVLYDDRVDATAGEKLADADLIGIPWRVIVSRKTGEHVEVKRRSATKVEILSIDNLVERL